MNVLRLIPEQGGNAIEIDQDRAFVGRDASSDVHLRDASVSRQHAEIRKNDDEWVIIDRNSGNGVLIDGVRTSLGVLLSGQRLNIGNVRFRVEIDRGNDGSTMILQRSPLAAGDATMNFGRPVKAANRSGVLLTLGLMAGALVVVGLGLGALYWWSPKPVRTAPRPAPLSLVTPTPAPTPSPVAPSPTPEVARKIQPPMGALLIATDIKSDVSVDGLRSLALAAGGLRRIEVSPGEHLVSFVVEGVRHDQVVRTRANEQAVVRFLAGATDASVQAPTASSSPASPLSTLPQASVSPLSPVSTPSLAPPTPTPFRTLQPDEGLLSGMSATTRGDYFRSLLILKDVVARLESDPQSKREFARAQAYLAWTYYGLKRGEEAQLAAEKAVKADPGVASQLDNFPAAVASLFKKPR